MGAFNVNIGRRIDSPVLMAAGQDSRNDVITTAVVVLGMVAGRFTTPVSYTHQMCIRDRLHIGKHTIFTYGGTIFGFFTNIAFYLIYTEIFCAICIKHCHPNLRKQAFSETFFTFGTLTQAAFLAFS